MGIAMNTKDTDLLFQTSEQLRDAAQRKEKIKAAKTVGSPVEVSGKILDMHVAAEDVWLAESGWQARRIDPEVRCRALRPCSLTSPGRPSDNTKHIAAR